MKTTQTMWLKTWLLAIVLSLGFSVSSFAERITTMTVENCTQTSPNSFYVDVYIQNTGTIDLLFRSANVRFNVAKAIIPAAGTMTAAIVPGYADPILGALTMTVTPATPIAAGVGNQLISVATFASFWNGSTAPLMAQTNKWRFCRIGFKASAGFPNGSSTNTAPTAAGVNTTYFLTNSSASGSATFRYCRFCRYRS
ncbi:MAG: hypothetical protein IPP38_11930 [Bacteroidetes bacterium]|nr:hypothetical protein [Bacteroidota bacterium]